jgi:hypothetical protein
MYKRWCREHSWDGYVRYIKVLISFYFISFQWLLFLFSGVDADRSGGAHSSHVSAGADPCTDSAGSLLAQTPTQGRQENQVYIKKTFF